MHWSSYLVMAYLLVGQRAFLSVFSEDTQRPAARQGDLGVFRILAQEQGILKMQADVTSLVPGALVLYRTNQSENGLKLAMVMRIIDLERDLHNQSEGISVHSMEKSDVHSNRYGALLRRYTDECNCAQNYPNLPRDFVKPLAEIHGVLYFKLPWLGLPILLLHRLKVFFAGAGIAGGIMTQVFSAINGRHVTLYDLDIETRGTSKRSTFIFFVILLCTVIAYFVYHATVMWIGVTATTVLGVFFFLYAGLHDVTLDSIASIREAVEDSISASVGGPAYYGWPVPGHIDRFYNDDISFVHAQGEGLNPLQLLRGRVFRYFARIAGCCHTSSWISSQNIGVMRFPHPDAKRIKLDEEQRGLLSACSRSIGVDEETLGEIFRCKLTGVIMKDPVVAADGFSYEREPVQTFLQRYSFSPVSNDSLGFRHVVNNNQLRTILEHVHANGSLDANFVEDELKCPITMSRMRDAVVTCDGHSYERSAILRWLRRHATSPKSNLLLTNKALITNRNISLLGNSLPGGVCEEDRPCSPECPAT